MLRMHFRLLNFVPGLQFQASRVPQDEVPNPEGGSHSSTVSPNSSLFTSWYIGDSLHSLARVLVFPPFPQLPFTVYKTALPPEGEAELLTTRSLGGT